MTSATFLAMMGLLASVGALADLAEDSAKDSMPQSGRILKFLEKQRELEAKIAALEAKKEVAQNQEDAQEVVVNEASHARNRGAGGAAQRKLQAAEAIAGLTVCLDYMWLLISGALVMFMQAGFAILEAGSCRQQSAATLLLKNMTDACLGTLVWYVLGYGIAYGLPEEPNEFVGVNSFAGGGFLEEDDEGGIIGTSHFKDWFFQWAFCATAATIVSGGVAERMQFTGYVIYSTFMTGIIYPFIVYWTWSGSGFLTEMGYSDFAGSGIVHLTGGVGALVGAKMVGPRAGRWDEAGDPGRFDPHNMPLVVLGTFVLWFGWYGFNCGSTLAFSDSG